jgi:hypothetical protein
MSSDKNRDLCELAIKKTLAYRSIFKYPLSQYQLKTFLISGTGHKNKVLNEAVEHLLNRGYIKETNNKYFLPGIKTVGWEEKRKLTDKIVRKNSLILNTIGRIPWVRMVAITGSLAAYNPDDASDIDVFIISSKNRVWITRFFVTLILKILNKFPNTDGEKGKICTNLYMDTKDLSWNENKRNIFIAHDIVLMQPVVDKENTYLRFLNANKWVLNYFSQFPINRITVKTKMHHMSGPIVDFIEKKLMDMQINHMRGKLTTEIITRYLIHFNKNDNCSRILESYDKVLANRRIS